VLPFIVGFFAGGMLATVGISIISASAYDKGRKDERRLYVLRKGTYDFPPTTH
jgi:hypothetical protein